VWVYDVMAAPVYGFAMCGQLQCVGL
jgi:hypothetical protein